MTGEFGPWNGNISKSFDFTTSTDLGAFGPVSDRLRQQEMSRVKLQPVQKGTKRSQGLKDAERMVKGW